MPLIPARQRQVPGQGYTEKPCLWGWGNEYFLLCLVEIIKQNSSFMYCHLIISGSLNENDLHKLMYLNTCSLVGMLARFMST